MRNRFDAQLEELQESMAEMGAECISAIADTKECLICSNHKKAKEVISTSMRIRRMEREIESLCLKLLLQQQPVASDLRVISSALKSVYDLERIGDVTGDIANLVLKENLSIASDLLNLSAMADETIVMVQKAVEALTKQDEELGKSAKAMDDDIDTFFTQAKKTIAKSFSGNENGMNYALNLLMVAKYFEKIGDHAINIANWAMFSATGILNNTEE